MIADDPFDVAKSTDRIGDVRFEIDPIEAARNDGLANASLPFLFRAGPSTAIARPSIRGNPRAKFVFEQAFEIDGVAEEIHPHFDEFDIAISRGGEFGQYHFVSRASEDDAHAIRGQRHAPISGRTTILTRYPTDRSDARIERLTITPRACPLL